MLQKPRRILVVDDQASARELLHDFLSDLGHLPEMACDGYEALVKVKLDVDLVLLDVKMPGMDGYEVCRRIRLDPVVADLPVIMVTGLHSRQDRLRAIEAGASDFIEKPVDVSELRVRCASMLEMKAARDALRVQQAHLEELVEQRTAALREALERIVEAQRAAYEAQLETIHRLALAAEVNDANTAAHIRRVSGYCAILARRLGLSPGDIELITHASALHDVGKVGVPTHLLRKQGKLEAHEWEQMKQHTLVGARILGGSPSPLLQAGEMIALSHHEKWDGSGYPHGVAGETIPLWGRICALADVFDALTSARSYKAAFSIDETRRIIARGRGAHFDPDLTDLFLRDFDEVLAVHETYQDELSLAPPALEGLDDRTVPPREAPREVAPSSRRLLVYDENPDAVEILCDILSMWGHEVRSPLNEGELLELAARFRPEVILLGLRHVGPEGGELARRLRSRDETRGAFLVAMTSLEQAEARPRAWEAGFDHHLSKPVDPAELQRLLVAFSDRDTAAARPVPVG